MPLSDGNKAANSANSRHRLSSPARQPSLTSSASRAISTIMVVQRWQHTRSALNVIICHYTETTLYWQVLTMTVRSTTDGTPDILLVNPLFISQDPVEKKLMTPYFPLGLLYLASVLRQNDYSVAMFDGTFEPDYDSFEQTMRDHQPWIVGITALITTRNHALKLAEIAKRYGAYIIFGGPDPTGKPEAYLRHTDSHGNRVVDVIVWDEGEATIIELMNHLTGRASLTLQQIKGLRYLNNRDELESTPRRPAIEDMDSIPFPARDLIDVEAYKRHWIAAHGYWSLSIINTRGCPYACTWCQKGIF